MVELSKREFVKGRHAQRRAVMKACSEVAKGTKWRANQGVLVSERAGWFLAVHEMTDVSRERTRARVLVKPMAIDPIFWELVGEPQLRQQSLTFRYFGAVSCPCLILEEPEVGEEGGPIEIARRMRDLGEARLSQIESDWTADDFLLGIRKAINPGRHFASTVSALIAEGRDREALELCDEAVSRSAAGGFVSRRGSFPQNAANWLRARAQLSN